MVCPTCLEIFDGTCAKQLLGQDRRVYADRSGYTFGKRGGGDESTIKTTDLEREGERDDRSLVGSVRLVRVIATPILRPIPTGFDSAAAF